MSGMRSNAMHFIGIYSKYIGTFLKLGICSNGDRNGTCGVQDEFFEGMSNSLVNVPSNNIGPSVDIGSNTFWLWFKDCVFGGNPYGASAITKDNAQAVVINPGTGTGSGLIHFQNILLNGGGIK